MKIRNTNVIYSLLFLNGNTHPSCPGRWPNSNTNLSLRPIRAFMTERKHPFTCTNKQMPTGQTHTKAAHKANVALCLDDSGHDSRRQMGHNTLTRCDSARSYSRYEGELCAPDRTRLLHLTCSDSAWQRDRRDICARSMPLVRRALVGL